eukprot:Lankesteria_metandrocarpae@DN4025_c0_g1_i1.p1
MTNACSTESQAHNRTAVVEPAVSPGQLLTHYSPRCPTFLLSCVGPPLLFDQLAIHVPASNTSRQIRLQKERQNDAYVNEHRLKGAVLIDWFDELACFDGVVHSRHTLCNAIARRPQCTTVNTTPADESCNIVIGTAATTTATYTAAVKDAVQCLEIMTAEERHTIIECAQKNLFTVLRAAECSALDATTSTTKDPTTDIATTTATATTTTAEIFIHLLPNLKLLGEGGMAIYDRIYRAASGVCLHYDDDELHEQQHPYP